MSTVALSGNDSVVINNRILADFADGNYAELKFANDIAAVKTGKNGNSIYALNATGKVAELVLRVIRGSGDDKFLMQLLNLQQNNFQGTTLMTGQMVKNMGDGAGNIAADTYATSGGVFTKIPEAKSNAEGELDQSVAIYTMKFSNAPRILT